MIKPNPQKRKQEISLAIKAEQELELVTSLLDEWDRQALKLLREAPPEDNPARLKAAVMAEMSEEFRKQLAKLMDTGRLARAQLDRDERRDANRRQQQGDPMPRVQ